VKSRLLIAASVKRAVPLCGLLLCLAALGTSAQEVRKVIDQPRPRYPEVAKTLRLSGTVKVQVTIGTDGQIKETKVLGGHPIFVDVTLDTLKKWRYAPGPAETTAQLEFNFHPPEY